MQGTQVSFFPTRAKYNQNLHKKRVYRLIKEASKHPQSKQFQTLQHKKSYQNIFDSQNYDQQLRNSNNLSKGVGFNFTNKFQMMNNPKIKLKTQNNERVRKISLSAANNQRQHVNYSCNNNDKKHIKTGLGQNAINKEINQFINTKLKIKTQQCYKSHSKYQTVQPLSKIFSTNTFARASKAQSQHSIKNVPGQQQTKSRFIAGINKQIQSNFDKKALLGQIDRVRPLVELCGDKYFEMILRNRFKEDMIMPRYIYQIKEKFTESKIIAKLRKYKPEIKERQRLQIKGKNKFS